MLAPSTTTVQGRGATKKLPCQAPASLPFDRQPCRISDRKLLWARGQGSRIGRSAMAKAQAYGGVAVTNPTAPMKQRRHKLGHFQVSTFDALLSKA